MFWKYFIKYLLGAGGEFVRATGWPEKCGAAGEKGSLTITDWTAVDFVRQQESKLIVIKKMYNKTPSVSETVSRTTIAISRARVRE